MVSTIVGWFLFALGLVHLLFPRAMFAIQKFGWTISGAQMDAEPQHSHVVLTRVVGTVMISAAVVMLLL